MSDLKNCPFCGSEIEIIPAHFENRWCVNVPSIICKKCHQTYEGFDIMQISKSEAQNEEFATDLFVSWWNTRPAEDALQSEIERLKGEVADRDIEGYAGFMIGVDQMKKTVAEKDKEIERLKEALKQIAEIASRRGHLTVATWQKKAWYELAKIAKEALAGVHDTNVGTMEENK